MIRVLQSWCPLIITLLLFLVIQCWLQLVKWKNWAIAYKEWVNLYCKCEAPGGTKPIEPTWP
jgi:hypothetical protein